MTIRLRFLVVSLCLAVASAYRPGIDGFLQRPEHNFTGEVWALLIAGSAGWGNYRHQADVCHAYQLLRHGGVSEDNIVVMMADDIAESPANPRPHQVFNHPQGPDVYEGVRIDYRGDAVTAANFLSVLAGQEPAVIGSSGRTIKSGPNDRVFVFYADHGAPGILGMPSGPFLYADQLMDTLKAKAKHRGFADLVLYIEACEAGSMFQGLLDESLSIYATTAANAHESSWATYCPYMKPAAPTGFTTCLGDLYSVSWMENSDHSNLLKETLEKQFELVRDRTSQNGSYLQGSHVLQFGSRSIDTEAVSDYLGEANTGDGNNTLLQQPLDTTLWPQRQADLLPLYIAATDSFSNSAETLQAHAALSAALAERVRVDKAVRAAVASLLAEPQVQAMIQEKYGGEDTLLQAGSNADRQSGTAEEHLVEMVVSIALPRPAGLPLVDDWNCLRGMVAAWQQALGPLDQYGMQHTRTFANLCNIGVPPQLLSQAASI